MDDTLMQEYNSKAKDYSRETKQPWYVYYNEYPSLTKEQEQEVKD